MSERLSHVEHQNASNTEIERAAAERLKSLEHSHERQNNSKQVEKARELIKQAEKHTPSHETTPKHESAPKRPILTKAENFRHTMISLQHRMKPSTRQFSRLIHTPAVEATSEVLGKTVLRPSVTLGATTSAVIIGGVLYLYARANGFSLSGSEIWFALVIGGVIGLIIEGIYRSLQRIRGRF